MRRPPADHVQRTVTAEERLCAVAELSTGLANAIREPDAEARASYLKSLVDRFGKGLGITVEILDKAVQHSVAELKRDAGALDLRSADGFLARAHRFFLASPCTGRRCPRYAGGKCLPVQRGRCPDATSDPTGTGSPQGHAQCRHSGHYQYPGQPVPVERRVAHHSRNHVSGNGFLPGADVRARPGHAIAEGPLWLRPASR